MNSEQAYGIAVLISGPSGVGKSTICRELHRNMSSVRFSVSCTTRSRRAEEINGKDYHFISVDEYNEHLKNGDFLEHAEVHGNLYGTLKDELDCLHKGKDVILDIDTQGVAQISQKIQEDEFLKNRVIKVFIMPPSMGVLRMRLEGRGSETPESLKRRLGNAAAEMAKWRNYDYVVINFDASEAAIELGAIIQSAHLRTAVLTKESWNEE